MKVIRKTTAAAGIIAALLLAFAPAAWAAGFIFKWEPFVIERSLIQGIPDQKDFIRDLSRFNAQYPDEYPNKSDFPASLNESGRNRTGESMLNNIRISIFSSDEPAVNGKGLYPADDEQMSRFVNALTSLIYDDSKMKSLENIGKVMEPRIKFYFEF